MFRVNLKPCAGLLCSRSIHALPTQNSAVSGLRLTKGPLGGAIRRTQRVEDKWAYGARGPQKRPTHLLDLYDTAIFQLIVSNELRHT